MVHAHDATLALGQACYSSVTVPTRKEETGIINANARTRQRRSAEPCSSDEFRRREAPDATRELKLPRPYDFDASLRFLPFGLYDPSCRRGPGTLWQATRTSLGATSFWVRLGEGAARAAAWGPGADWILARLEGLLATEVCGTMLRRWVRGQRVTQTDTWVTGKDTP